MAIPERMAREKQSPRSASDAESDQGPTPAALDADAGAEAESSGEAAQVAAHAK